MNNILKLSKVPTYNNTYSETPGDGYGAPESVFIGCNYNGRSADPVKSVMYELKKYMLTDPQLKNIITNFYKVTGAHGPILKIKIKKVPYNPTIYSAADLQGSMQYSINDRGVDPWSDLSDYGKNIVTKLYDFAQSYRKEVTTGLHEESNFFVQLFFGDGAPLVINDYTDYKTVIY